MRARKARHWSQEQLAAELGVHSLTVGRWEKGERTPYPFHRRKLCQIFGQTEEALGFVPGEKEASPPADMLLDSSIPLPPEMPWSGVTRC